MSEHKQGHLACICITTWEQILPFALLFFEILFVFAYSKYHDSVFVKKAWKIFVYTCEKQRMCGYIFDYLNM